MKIMRALKLACLSLCLVVGMSSTRPLVATPSYQDIKVVVNDNCVGCHSSDFAFAEVVLDNEESLAEFASSVFDAVSSGFMPPINPVFNDPADGQLLLEYLESLLLDELVYTDIAGILQASCLSCHRGPQARRGVRLDTEQFAIANASRALNVVARGTMPPRRPDFRNSTDGLLLLEWLNNPLSDSRF